MKLFQVLMLFSIFFGISCQQVDYLEVETLLSSDVESSEVNNLINEIQERLNQAGILHTEIVVRNDGMLIINSKIPQDKLIYYNSLLQPQPLELWSTFRISDSVIIEIPADKLNVDGFIPFYEFNKGMYPDEVMGTCKDEAQLERIQMELEDSLSIVDDLRIIWSSKPQDDGEREYLMYMIDTKGEESAPITESMVERSSVDYHESSEEYSVSFILNTRGTEVWLEITTRAYAEYNRCIAIIVGNKLLSCPRVIAPIYSGSCQMAKGLTQEEAVRLKNGILVERYSNHTKIVNQDVKLVEEN